MRQAMVRLATVHLDGLACASLDAFVIRQFSQRVNALLHPVAQSAYQRLDKPRIIGSWWLSEACAKVAVAIPFWTFRGESWHDRCLPSG